MAYIDRAEAWNIYEPLLRQSVDTFRNLYRAAEEDTEPFRQITRYGAALKSSRDIGREILFARILDPVAAEQFGDILTAAASIPQKIQSAKSRSTIFIQCSSDNDGTVQSAVSKILSAQGFPVTTNKNAAAVICEVNINENKQTLPAGTFYTPSVNIIMNGKTQSLSSFSASVDEPVVAHNPDVARQRAYAALANTINQTFTVAIE
jgi:hypothetical protein